MACVRGMLAALGVDNTAMACQTQDGHRHDAGGSHASVEQATAGDQRPHPQHLGPPTDAHPVHLPLDMEAAEPALGGCCEVDCARGTLTELGLDRAITVGQVRMALRAGEGANVCVGGKRLPELRDATLDALDIDMDAGAIDVLVCPSYTFVCCPEATIKRKPAPKLGLEKYLTLWILLAVAAGLALGQVPGIDHALHKLKIGKTNILTAVGMILMLLPPFASVRYNEFVGSISQVPKRIALGSIVMNWLIGPFLMGGLGMLTLGNQHDLLEGVIFIGAARCIAMVLVWTALAEGDSFLCVSLVLVNSIITVFSYAPMVTLLGVVFGIHSGVTFMTVLQNVAIYLGTPLVIGFSMWCIGSTYFADTYWSNFLPRFAPVGLLSLLWTCLIMFTEMSKPLTSGDVAILDIFFVMIPLSLYFLIMFFVSWFLGKAILRIGYGQTVTFAFTAASNNFELALAACTAIFGTSSRQAAAAVIGPLIEIPVMLGMVRVALCLKYDQEAHRPTCVSAPLSPAAELSIVPAPSPASNAPPAAREGGCRDLRCARGTLKALGLDKMATVGQVRASVGAARGDSVCVGGKCLLQEDDVALDALGIDACIDPDVLVCPNNMSGEELPCCPAAALKAKSAPKLGLEKYLTLWILLAVAAGLALGQVPDIDKALHKLKVGKTNILTAVGMILMLLPPFASVRYDEFVGSISRVPKRIAFGSIVMNWLIGPFLMGGLGMLTLGSQHDLLEGVIFIGAARCIAMVLVWTALAEGDSFLCVSLVLLNSVITVFSYAPMVTILGTVFGIHSGVTFVTVLQNVAIYLGIPLVLGVSMWLIGSTYFADIYWSKFLPTFAPVGLLSLLWTCLIMFTEMSQPLTSGDVAVLDVFFVMIPLTLYFLIMFFFSWFLGKVVLAIGYGQTVTFAFTAASNNFELALAACTAIFGTASRQAAAAVIGPLIEIPVMLGMVRIALRMKYGEERERGQKN